MSARKEKSYKDQISNYHKIGKLKKENQELRRKVTRYKVRLHRLLTNSNSPYCKLNRDLVRNCFKVSSQIRSRLLFGDALKEDLQGTVSSMRSRKEHRSYLNNIKLRFLIKYRFMSTVKLFIPVSCNTSPRRNFATKNKLFFIDSS